MKNLIIFLTFLFCSSFFHSFEDGTLPSTSPNGDVRMGSDVIKSGTDIDDKSLQEQEDVERKINQDENLKKSEKYKEKRTNEILKNF